MVRSYVICFALLASEFAFFRDKGQDDWEFVAAGRDATQFDTPEAARAAAARFRFRATEYVVAVVGVP